LQAAEAGIVFGLVKQLAIGFQRSAFSFLTTSLATHDDQHQAGVLNRWLIAES
jgi:hypothetical protein